jgi:hypothetical protein
MQTSSSTANVLLLDEIVRIPRREIGGSQASNRGGYQESWAFCLLLKLHSKKDDYLVLLDFHDDVVVLDSATNPKTIDFYQIKTKKSGHWTISLLIKPQKTKSGARSLSIASKMYANKLAFPQQSQSLNFVSNVPFRVRIKDKPSKMAVDSFELTHLLRDGLKDFSRTLQQEHNLPYSPICDIITRFTTDPLSIDGHSDHALGQFANFLTTVKGDGKYAVTAGFKSIATTISRKIRYEKDITNPETLVAAKAISRKEFDNMLSTIVSHEEEKDRWSDIRQTLIAENYSFSALTRWHNCWKKYAIHRLDHSNLILSGIQKQIRLALKESRKTNPDHSLRELIEDCLTRFQVLIGKTTIPYNDDYLTAIILYEATE